MYFMTAVLYSDGWIYWWRKLEYRR